ncbi:hypothetical protein B0H12DRAFT_1152840 [Mycena haematopus]|nr:hypothetical protein B0H12DRAFT_1152840 [Mycena haematopus]
MSTAYIAPLSFYSDTSHCLVFSFEFSFSFAIIDVLAVLFARVLPRSFVSVSFFLHPLSILLFHVTLC